MYTKEGEVGVWSTMFGIIPDLGLGFNAFTAGVEEHSAEVENLANIVAAHALPAAQEVARQQAKRNFGGRWSRSTNRVNVSVTLSTGSQPALKISDWTSNGTNVLSQIDSPRWDARLWPNQIYTGDTVGFTMSFEPLLKPGYVERPLKLNCET
jgi:hypothetical protein